MYLNKNGYFSDTKNQIQGNISLIEHDFFSIQKRFSYIHIYTLVKKLKTQSLYSELNKYLHFYNDIYSF